MSDAFAIKTQDELPTPDILCIKILEESQARKTKTDRKVSPRREVSKINLEMIYV